VASVVISIVSVRMLAVVSCMALFLICLGVTLWAGWINVSSIRIGFHVYR
jgi:hypothetical protein